MNIRRTLPPMISAKIILAPLIATLFCGLANAQQPPDPVTSDGNFNTAVGLDALLHNQNKENSHGNTATGFAAMIANSGGYDNTANGMYSLYSNATGYYNTGVGWGALFYSKGAFENTSVGYKTLYENLSGNYNVAVGSHSLTNSTASYNTAVGQASMYGNTSGASNVAVGNSALYSNSQGNFNMAIGSGALLNNSVGSSNTAVGAEALSGITTGYSNIGIGYSAGTSLAPYSIDNIDIGSTGTSSDSGTIRIGTSQTSAFVQGIYTTKLASGMAVGINQHGQLGLLNASSERLKTDIKPLAIPDRLERLRPVTFRYKSDPQGPLHYGLIAEEVMQVYPDLVVRDEKGHIDGVRYDELTPLLLKQVQNLQLEQRASDQRNKELQSAMQAQKTRIDELQGQLTTVIASVVRSSGSPLLAMH